MKKTVSMLMIFLIGMSLPFLFAGTVTDSYSPYSDLKEKPHCITYTETEDFDDATVTLSSINGYIEGVVINSNGTDTSYKVYLLDENGIAIFTKEDCSSSAEPYRYTVSVAGTDGNDFARPMVIGTPYIQIADANDASMDELIVKVYVRQWRK